MTPKKLESTRIESFIKELGEEELLYINRLVVERLKLLSQAKSTQAMSRFNVGERVEFTDHAGTGKTGVIVRLNKKTATVVTTDGRHWNVAPALLRGIDGT